MLIILSLIYGLPIYLVFFYFKWLPLNKVWWTVILTPPILAAIFLWFAIGHYTPLAQDAYVQAAVLQIAPQVNGQVTEVLVQDNQAVTSGTPLFRIDPRPYSYQMGQAEAQLITAQEQSAASIAGMAASQQAMRGAESQVLAAQSSVEAAKAMAKSASENVRALEARNTYAQKELERKATLVAQAVISQRDYDQALSDADSLAAQTTASIQQALQAESSVALAENQLATAVTAAWEARLKYLNSMVSVYPLKVVDAGITTTLEILKDPRLAAEDAPTTADKALEEVPLVLPGRDRQLELDYSRGLQERLRPRAAFLGLQLPNERAAQEALNSAEFNLSQTEVVSPANGTVSHLQLAAGDYARAGAPILNIIDHSDWWMVAPIPENWLGQVRPGDKVLYSLRNYPASVRTAKVRSVSRGVYQGQGIPNGNLADTHPRIIRQFDTPQTTQQFQVVVELADDRSGEPLRVGDTARAVIFASGGLAGLNALMSVVVHLFSFFDYFFPKPSPVAILILVVAVVAFVEWRKKRKAAKAAE